MKQPNRFEQTLKEIKEIRMMLDGEGQNDGKSRYLEIMATILLFIEDSLSVIRSLLCIGLGFAFALFLNRVLMGG
jgi:hypothetical protein